MKLYKALCITGALTLIAMVAALAMNLTNKKYHSAISAACGKFSAGVAFGLAAVFTALLIGIFVKVMSDARANKQD